MEEARASDKEEKVSDSYYSAATTDYKYVLRMPGSKRQDAVQTQTGWFSSDMSRCQRVRDTGVYSSITYHRLVFK